MTKLNQLISCKSKNLKRICEYVYLILFRPITFCEVAAMGKEEVDLIKFIPQEFLLFHQVQQSWTPLFAPEA